VSGNPPTALRNLRVEGTVIRDLILAALVGWTVMYLIQSSTLAVAAGVGVALLRLVRRARAMWRDAHD
jgi:hypothetical protein